MLFFLRAIVFRAVFGSIVLVRIVRSGNIRREWKRAIAVLYGAELFAYLYCLFSFRRFSESFFDKVQDFNVVWVMMNCYAAIVIISFTLIYFFRKKSLYAKSFLKLKYLGISELICISVSLVFLFGYEEHGTDNYLRPQVKNLGLCIFMNKRGHSRLKNPENLKIVVVSDIHLGALINRKVLDRYVGQIDSLKPDAVVIDGDLVDYELSYLIRQRMDIGLRSLKARYGVFCIPGNHEYKFNPDLKFRWIRSTGLVLLKDSCANIGKYLTIVGRDDLSNKEDRKSLSSLMEEVPPKRTEILFSHQPGDIKDGYAYHIPLTVCGHTHGGQIFPFTWVGRFLQKNNYGLKRHGSSYSYVTSGIGLSGIPMRLLSHSEILVLNIRIY